MKSNPTNHPPAGPPRTMEEIEKQKDQLSDQDRARLEGPYGVEEPEAVADDEEE